MRGSAQGMRASSARSGPHTLAIIAAATGCDTSVGELSISGLASLEDAAPDQISYSATTRHTFVPSGPGCAGGRPPHGLYRVGRDGG
jgi:hypothetical protein